MVIRAQVGTVKPNPHFHGHTSHNSSISPIPKSPSVALSDPNWRDVMYDEYNALIKNSTWVLILKPPNVNVVRSMWLFRDKYHADSTLSRCKARLVANGRSQQFRVDCNDTFSPVVKLVIIRMVLSLAFHQDKRTVLVFRRLVVTRPCLYINMVSEVAYLLIYFDEIVLMASSTNLLQRIISSLNKEFDMTDVGAFNYFLGILVTRDSTGMFLSQKKYAWELLNRDHMANCNPTRMPVDIEFKLGSDRDHVSDPTQSQSCRWFAVPYIYLSKYLSCSVTGDLHLCSHSQPNDNILSLDRVLKLSTEVLLMLLPQLPSFYQRTRHIEIDIHFVRDMIARGQVRVLHAPSRYQYVDIFTKGLPSALFEEFRFDAQYYLSERACSSNCVHSSLPVLEDMSILSEKFERMFHT
ncbi:ribonuclease H-like domain-containing protein [Tanacetum coccineum]